MLSCVYVKICLMFKLYFGQTTFLSYFIMLAHDIEIYIYIYIYIYNFII
jgi:hypothetical protein